MIVGRDNILDILDSSKDSNLFLTGERGTGKSLILKEAAKRRQKNSVYAFIDFERISLSPENFAVEYIEKITDAAIGKSSFSELTEKDTGKAFESILKIKNELEKIKPNHRLLFELAINFPEQLSYEISKKITVCADELWKIEELSNYSQIKDSILLLKNIISGQRNVRYYATGSAETLSKHIAETLGWKITEIKNFDRRDIKELAAAKKSKADTEKIFRLSYGMPFVADILLDGKDFNKEMLCKKGMIYSYLNSILNEKLGRARGKSQLWVILKKLSQKEMKLAEISREIYRSSPITKNLLTRLVEVDLITQEGSMYSFANKLLKEFVHNITSGKEYDSFEEAKEEQS